MTVLSSVSHVQGWRAGLLWFPDPHSPQARHETDGLLVTGQSADGIVRVLAIGPYRELASQYPDLPVTHWPGLCIAPGFVDLHIHYPQTDVIGSPADGLLPWLEHYTFPHEKQFGDPAYAHEVTSFFLDELLRHGVTTALCFAMATPIARVLGRTGINVMTRLMGLILAAISVEVMAAGLVKIFPVLGP